MLSYYIDAEDVNITTHLRESSSFIKHVEKLNGRVMVHCIAGVSRSVTLVIMHLMYIHKLKLKFSYESIQAIR